MRVSIERSANFYRTLKWTYTLFIRFRGNVYRVHLVHVPFKHSDIVKDFRAILKENAELKAKLKKADL